QQLDDALTRHLPDLARARVYISQYPDPLHDANSNLCREGWHPDPPLDYGGFFPSPRAGDIDVLSALTLRENVWLDTTALLELNDTIEFNASSGFGWNTVIGIADLTRNHGVCAGQARWFRQGIESLVLQGPAHSLPVDSPLIGAIDSAASLFEVLLGEKATKGVIHPNHTGHRAIADLFLASLAGTGVLPAPDTTPP